MVRIMGTACIVICLSAISLGQYRDAPNGYYPDNYMGATFIGEITDVNESQLTLTYTKKNKVETFTGRFEAPCSVPLKNGRAMKTSELPKGTVLTAFFITNTKKVNGQKEKENVVIAISVAGVQGVKIEDLDRVVSYCKGMQRLVFKAWGSN